MLLDNEGYVAEGSGENIFIVEKGRLITPELTSCLEGITRSTVLTLAEVGIEVEEKRITRDQVYIAEEAFYSGTATEVLPIKGLDGRRIGEGKRGPITENLQHMYFDQVMKKDSSHPEWSTLVV